MGILGKNEPSVSDIGLGCMGMCDLYGPADETESIATIHAALDAGRAIACFDVVPLVGARRRDRLTEALDALKLTLTSDDLQQIERAVPKNAAAGDRYAAAQMSTLDSEAKPSQ